MPSAQQQEVDSTFEKGGPFTPYQIIIQTTTIYLCLVTCYNNVLAIFTGDNPPWKCNATATTQFCDQNRNHTFASDDPFFSKRCDFNRTDWTFASNRDYSFVTEYDLVCSKTWMGALITSSYYVGGLMGCSVSGIAADRFGRKPIILISLIVTTLSMVASGYITSIWQLGLLNLIGGAGTYGSFMCSNVYQAEFIPPKYRAISTNLLLTGFTFSFFLIDLFAYYIREWRHLTVYVALPSIIAIVAFFILPESPRWLLIKERESEARSIIQKVTKHDVPLAKIEEEEPSPTQSYSFLHLFNNLTVLKQTLSIGSLWIMMTIIWYTIALGTGSLGGDMYEAFALSNISDLLSYGLAVVLCSYLGRKKCILINFLITGILLLILIIVRVSFQSIYIVNIVLTSLARLAINTAAGGIFVWTNELFPTILRSRGYFFCAMCDRLSVIAVPFITRLLQEVNPIMPYIISVVLSGCGFLSGFMLPETLNQPTRETYDDFFEMKDMKTKARSPSLGLENPALEKSDEYV